MSGVARSETQWPELPWGEWAATANTLHMWTQIVGKTRLALTPLQNHWWNVPLYVTARGLGTSAMPYGDDVLDIEFDFVGHVLHLRRGSGKDHRLPLRAQTVADFYKEYLECLAALGVSVEIWPMPVEVANPMSAPPPLGTRATWKALTMVEPHANVSGSTSVLCSLSELWNLSVLSFTSGS